MSWIPPSRRLETERSPYYEVMRSFMSGTGIRVKDVAIRLRRIPVGFYVAVESEL